MNPKKLSGIFPVNRMAKKERNRMMLCTMRQRVEHDRLRNDEQPMHQGSPSGDGVWCVEIEL